jgi:2-hydroxycyclohexanecarboxyl-CoA dehydrogenase
VPPVADAGALLPGRLQGLRALITGGGAGIGAATARLFCAEGAHVALLDADEAALSRTLDALRTAHPRTKIVGLQADIGQAAAVHREIGRAVEALGGLDILINNAAMRDPVPIIEAGDERWQALLSVNLTGTAQCCRAALPALRAAGASSIVNVSSCYAVAGRPGMALYDASKAAMLALTRSLAHEEAAHGVRVNAVCPGSTLTDFHLARAKASGIDVATLVTQRSDTSLLGRWARPDEIAWPILWLASAEASFITGTTLMVDGGLHVH